jgi:hypothetical protein
VLLPQAYCCDAEAAFNGLIITCTAAPMLSLHNASLPVVEGGEGGVGCYVLLLLVLVPCTHISARWVAYAAHRWRECAVPAVLCFE